MARYLKINGKVCLDTLRDMSRPCLFIACRFLVSDAKIHFSMIVTRKFHIFSMIVFTETYTFSMIIPFCCTSTIELNLILYNFR